MITPGTLYKFRRRDLIEVLREVPQQVRPPSMDKLTKAELQGELLRIARALPQVAARAEEVAERIESPHRALAQRAAKDFASLP